MVKTKCFLNAKKKILVDFDENLLSFSSTLLAIKKFSNNQNNLNINFCNSNIIKIIQEWLYHRYFRFNNIEFNETFKNNNFDKNFFNSIANKYKYNKKSIIIELILVADYLNISSLINSPALFIAILVR